MTPYEKPVALSIGSVQGIVLGGDIAGQDDDPATENGVLRKGTDIPSGLDE